ncbi:MULTISPECIES: hypothetical protein [unclassified Streptomyces]|uniref:hypothetical protein n=1 Tax=unclassified Streptomyces TaxID=2593676 RepID=UPI002250ED53|nr:MULTISPECIES: hypothetical protein [unclassified Streptomyces]MCX5047436.1 hypothetical protein [Streptomyces sp. NBC_00474]
MGIRMLNRRPARAQASAEAASAAPPAPMPAFAARASTARIPTDLVVVLRRTAKRLRRRLRRPAPTPGEPSVWRLWAGLGRSYLTALIARTRHARAARATPTIPVFIVTTGTLTERRDGGAGR